MKFGIQFEFHKIPEWYTEYLDYMRFKHMISTFKKKLKSIIGFLTWYIGNEVQKLRGLYYLTSKNYVNQMDILSKLKTKKGWKKGTIREDNDIENGSPLEFEAREGYKDDSYLLGR